MPRIKRGVTANEDIKVLKAQRATMGLGPGFLEWRSKQLLRLDNMPTEIDGKKRRSELFGFSELTQRQENVGCHTVHLLMA